jgi:adenosylhomocysteine nucleosidase
LALSTNAELSSPIVAELDSVRFPLPGSAKVAIVAALEREIHGLVKNWRVVRREHENRQFKFFESENVVAVCGGIGPEAARRAGEAAVAIYKAGTLVSAGFAGALDPSVKVGQIFLPGRVIDTNDSSRRQLSSGQGVLVSSASVAGAEQKARLAKAYGAQAVDMEAAAVGRVSDIHAIDFAVVKAVSDEYDFQMLPMDRFVGADGQFRSEAFAWYAAVRPWLWPRVIRLARNSAMASRALCLELERYIREAAPAAAAEPRTILN